MLTLATRTILMSIQEILKMPASDRLQIVEQIWDSLEPADIAITEAQKAELDRRIMLDKSGELEWHSLQQVKSKLHHKK